MESRFTTRRHVKSSAVLGATITALVMTGSVGSARADADADIRAAITADKQHDYASELRLLAPLAEKGDARAQCLLGFLSADGSGVPANYDGAAAQGYCEFPLGKLYENGLGVPKDYSEAAKWFRIGVGRDDDAVAETELGFLYAAGGFGISRDFAVAVRWLRRAAEQGNAEAEGMLGAMYNDGKGVPEDYSQSTRWSRKAAEQGKALAQKDLADLYYAGLGVPKDDDEATRWYRKAAEQGNAEAQALLGAMYGDGDGVPKDYVEGYMWLNLAVAGGFKSAAQRRDELERRMTPQQVAEAQQRSASWQPMPTEQQQTTTPPVSTPAPQQPSASAPLRQPPVSASFGTGFSLAVRVTC
jgi:uncharacterized protein